MTGTFASTGDGVLDRMLDGGFPRERATLLSGGPGTGKSTLAMQFLQAGLAEGEAGLFISTEQRREELRDSFADYEFDLEDERLAITTLQATPAGDGNGDEDLLMRTLDRSGGLDKRRVSFTAENVVTYLREGVNRDIDRVVLDSVSGLQVMADDTARFRRAVLELIRLFTDDIEATTVFTAESDGDEPAGDNPLQYTTHGVLRLWREHVNEDPHRFLEIRKMRGVDHDPRAVELQFTETGIRAAPERRSQPPALKTHAHTPTGVDGLDQLCGGGLATGVGVLIEQDGQANLAALYSDLLGAALEREHTIALMPTIRLRPGRLKNMLADHGTDMGELLDHDRLFVFDAIGTWDASRSRNVFDLSGEQTLQDVKGALDAAIDRSDDSPWFSLVNADAIVNTLGPDEARNYRYYEESQLRRDDMLVHVTGPAIADRPVGDFYVNSAEQVLRTWIADDGLQYVTLKKSPCGFVGTTSLVEYAEEPPYLRVQHPPASRENPYAETDLEE